jgi:predicted DsbA family dithiol-disulfide isomerase
LKELATTRDVAITWRSYELRPAGSPPISHEYLARIKAGQPRLQAIAQQQAGVELNQGPFGQNSRPALIGAKYAESQGRSEAYHQAVFEAYWLHAQTIEHADDLAQIAVSIGLDEQEFRAALADPRYEAEVEFDIQQAQAYGLSGVPAIVFENQYLLSGAQPIAALRQVVDRLEEEQQNRGTAEPQN